MNEITLSGRVISILESETKGQRVANCLLQEYNGGKSLTYQASFWGDTADYVHKKVAKNDDVALTGYVYRIKNGAKGPYIELRNCQLQYIIPHNKITVEDVSSLRQKGVEKNGTDA